VLGLAPDIERQWKALKKTGQNKDGEDTEFNHEEEASDGEGSLYDGEFEEEQANRNAKRRRKINTKPAKRAKPSELSGLILPRKGDKTVAGEAFGKLSAQQQKIVAANVNKKTKKVIYLPSTIHYNRRLPFMLYFFSSRLQGNLLRSKFSKLVI
jgi:hypothetical protein